MLHLVILMGRFGASDNNRPCFIQVLLLGRWKRSVGPQERDYDPVLEYHSKCWQSS